MAILASILTLWHHADIAADVWEENVSDFFWETTIGSSNFAGKNSETGILWMVQKYG